MSAVLKSAGGGKARGGKVSDRYKVVSGDLVEDREDILRLWQYLPTANPPGQRKLRDFYEQGPAGPGRVLFLEHIEDNQRIGVVCLRRRQFLHNGNIVNGVVFGDFAIEPAHRSLGPALLFQKTFLELAWEEYDLVYGFPNDSSGSVRVFGGHKLNGEVVAYKLPLDPGATLARKLGLPRVLAGPVASLINLLGRPLMQWRLGSFVRQSVPVDVDDQFLDDVWASVRGRGDALGVRDAVTVRWRLEEVPEEPFSLFGVTDQQGQPAAWLAFSVNSADRTVRIVDYLAVSPAALQCAIAGLAQLHRRARVVSIKLISHEAVWISAVTAMGFAETKRSQHFASICPPARERMAPEDFRLSVFDNDA